MSRINNRYETLEMIGKGGFGEVYRIKDLYENGKILALKKIRSKVLSKKAIKIFKEEFRFLTTLNHPNLVTVYDFGIDKESDELFFTMEYIEGETLYKKAKLIKEDERSKGYSAYSERFWNEMENYAQSKEEFLRTFLDLSNVIPSHDTFNRMFSNIDSAWANENNLVLGQVKVSEKSNEITAIPMLLDALSLENTIVTIHATGCQTKIASAIIDKKADYILAVKGNQPKLLEQIEDEFRFGKTIETNTTDDLDHRRMETRKCSIISNFHFIPENNNWCNLNTIIKIEGTREFKN